MRLKCWEPQKVHLRFLLKLYTSFQLPNSIYRGVIRGTNSKNEKNEENQPKNYFFAAVEGVKWGWKVKTPTSKSRTYIHT